MLSTIIANSQQRLRGSFLQRGETGLLALYACFGVLVLLATLFFNFIVPQTPARMERVSVELFPRLSLWSWLTSLPVPVPETQQAIGFWLICFTVIAFAGYGAALLLGMKRGGSNRMLIIVAGIGVFFSFTNLWSLPNLNTDIYNYMVRGRVFAVYGQNPYAVAANEFSDDPIYPYASERYTEQPAGKLPTWMALNSLLAKIAGDDPITNLLTYRLAFFLLNAANLGLVILITRVINVRWVLAAAILYSWNPITILFAQSKTDTLMAFFVLLAAWALVTRRNSLLTLTFLMFSVFIKLITAPLVVVYMLRSIKLKRWKEVVSGVGIGAVFLIVVGLLFFIGGGYSRLVYYTRVVSDSGPSAPDPVRYVVMAFFIGLMALLGLLQDGTDRRLLFSWAIILMFLTTFISPFALAWYLIPTIALVAVTVNWRINILLVALSFSSFLFNAWDSTFSSSFPPPDMVSISRTTLHLSLPLIIAAYFLARLLWRNGPSRLSGSSSSNR